LTGIYTISIDNNKQNVKRIKAGVAQIQQQIVIYNASADDI